MGQIEEEEGFKMIEEFDSWHSNDCEEEKHDKCCYANTGCTCWCHDNYYLRELGRDP